MHIITTATGMYEEVRAKSTVPVFDPVTKEHLWIVQAIWKWNPDSPKVLLDHENLLSMSPPLCYYCEKTYSFISANESCGGDS